MARIKLYPNDTTITGGDRLVGTDINGNATKNYQIEEIAKYFAKSSSADSTGVGFQFNYAGKYSGQALQSGDFRYQVDPSAPTQFGWANVTAIAFSRYTANATDINPIASLYKNQIVKITDIGTANPSNYGVYKIISVTSLTDAFLFSTSLEGASGKTSTSVIALAATGISKTDSFFTFTQDNPSAIWNIQHDLEKFPSVTVIDSANDVVYGNVTYVDENNLTINFSAPFSGKAYLN